MFRPLEHIFLVSGLSNPNQLYFFLVAAMYPMPRALEYNSCSYWLDSVNFPASHKHFLW